VDQALLGIEAIDAASAGRFGERFEIGFGVAAEEREMQTALAAGAAVARRGVAAELAEKRADFVEERGRHFARTLPGDVELLLTAGGVDLDESLAVGHGCDDAAFADCGDFAVGRLELRLWGDVADGSIGELAGDHDPLHGPLAVEREIAGRSLNAGELEPG